NLSVESVEPHITDRTRAVIAVHFCGYPANVVGLRELCDSRGILLIEDAAQGIGAVVSEDGRKAGSVGQAGCLSFFSKKQLFVGEGGMVLTSDEEIDKKVRLLRSHGMSASTWDRHRGYGYSYDVVDVGYNFRLDEPRAALGLSRLGKPQTGIEARRRTAKLYPELLADVPAVDPTTTGEPAARPARFPFPALRGDAR